MVGRDPLRDCRGLQDEAGSWGIIASLIHATQRKLARRAEAMPDGAGWNRPARMLSMGRQLGA